MGIFRSEDMEMYQVTIPKDDAWYIMNELGNLGVLQFVDLNRNEQPFHLTYANQIRRCDDALKKLSSLETECKNFRVKLSKPKSVKAFLDCLNVLRNERKKAENVLLDDIESDIERKEKFISEQVQTLTEMQNNKNTLVEHRCVLQVSQQIITGAYNEGAQVANQEEEQKGIELQGIRSGSGKAVGNEGGEGMNAPAVNQESKVPLLQQMQNTGLIQINYLAGTIVKNEQMRMKKMVYRATRGKALTHFQDLVNADLKDYTGLAHGELRTVFVIVFQDGLTIRDKLMKICDSFNGKNFEIPRGGDVKEIERKVAELTKRIDDSTSLIATTQVRLREFLRDVQKISQNPNQENISLIELYKLFLNKEKLCFTSLNKLKKGDKLFLGYCWVPTCEKKITFEKIESIKEKNKNIEIPTFQVVSNHGIKPPTLFKTNEFTEGFQEIVNTYGTPNYKEANPAVFTCVTFPFLFGIMFGDIGHGSILCFTGIMLCLLNQTIRKNAPSMAGLLKIRYLILLMGFFAAFSGFIYNDFMSIPLFIFHSCYPIQTDHDAGHSNTTEHNVEMIQKQDCVYPIGVDPAWYLSVNELNFMNSLKMKISVILGVLQMSLGVCLKASNALYRQNKLDFILEFIPQIILLLVLFGYMDLMIICKWLTDFTNREHEAPSVISMMIGMFLNGGKIEDGQQAVVGSNTGQQALSIIFLIIALICVPWMLIPKPFIIDKHNREHKLAHPDDHGIQLHELDKDKEQKGLLDDKNEIKEEQKDQKEQQQQISTKVFDHKKELQEYKMEELLENEPGDDAGHNEPFSDLLIHQLIETIEFVLGTVSNTASYLRLWALSLAHGQLAAVFFENTVLNGLEAHTTTASFFLIWIGYFIWASITVGVLLAMDVMECFLHTLRLHWVEFQNKFYKGNGYKFVPFSYELQLDTYLY